MRKLQRFCASLSLALALSIPTLAGEIQTGAPLKSSPLSPLPPQSDATSVDPLAELALALLNGVLSIF